MEALRPDRLGLTAHGPDPVPLTPWPPTPSEHRVVFRKIEKEVEQQGWTQMNIDEHG